MLDIQLNRRCSSAEDYPRIAGRSVVGGVASVRRRFSDRVSVEVFGATEQSGTATGHCDNRIVPKDVRCAEDFMVVDFSGGSFASLVVIAGRHVSLGAGPAIFFANWRVEPAHLPGVWVDATYAIKASPWIARAQYRLYRSATDVPEQRFSRFHPSTVFLGLGFIGTSTN